MYYCLNIFEYFWARTCQEDGEEGNSLWDNADSWVSCVYCKAGGKGLSANNEAEKHKDIIIIAINIITGKKDKIQLARSWIQLQNEQCIPSESNFLDGCKQKVNEQKRLGKKQFGKMCLGKKRLVVFKMFLCKKKQKTNFKWISKEQ